MTEECVKYQKNNDQAINEILGKASVEIEQMIIHQVKVDRHENKM